MPHPPILPSITAPLLLIIVRTSLLEYRWCEAKSPLPLCHGSSWILPADITLLLLQREDLVAFGQLILALACNSLLVSKKEHIATSIDLVKRHFTSDLLNVIMYVYDMFHRYVLLWEMMMLDLDPYYNEWWGVEGLAISHSRHHILYKCLMSDRGIKCIIDYLKRRNMLLC